MKNKKGFTLVELLAVIVILALIMSIAVISIGGVLDSTRKSTFKETAVSIISGVRQQLILANQLDSGDYQFTKSLLEKGGTESPLGGTFNIDDSFSSCSNAIGSYVCKVSSSNTAGSCTSTTKSFVHVTKNNNVVTYSICLTAGSGKYYINNGNETDLLDSNNNNMITNS